MDMNATYHTDSPEPVARALLRAGLWDCALDVLDPGASALRAQILTDRFWWRLDGAAEAEHAAAVLEEQDAVLGGFYAAQLAYARMLFGIGPRPDDAERTCAGFRSAMADR
jgi:hypothetical protein